MKLKYDFIIQEVAGNFMAVATGAGAQSFKGMIRLNGTAKRMFELIQEGKDEAQIVETMSQEYEVAKEDLETAVSNFVGSLKKENLIEA